MPPKRSCGLHTTKRPDGSVNGMEKLPDTIRDRIIGLEHVPPDQLTAHPQNFRLHPTVQRKALRASLERFGWAQPILVTKDGTVVDGHARVEEALSGGLESVPVIRLDMDEAEAAQLLLRLDPIAAMAATDTDILSELLAIEEWAPDEEGLADDLKAIVGGSPKDLDLDDHDDGLPPDMFYETVSLLLDPDVAAELRSRMAAQAGSNDSERMSELLGLTVGR